MAMRGIAKRARRRPKALVSRRSGRVCGPSEGVEKVLTMRRIACNFPPTRRAAYAISMSHDRRSLV